MHAPHAPFRFIRKRHGPLEAFDPERIATAIGKALAAVGTPDSDLAHRLADQVVQRLAQRLPYGSIPHVEEVQDTVEEVLIQSGLAQAAKAYILYRQQRAQMRQAKRLLGVGLDELKLSVNAVKVLEQRYLLKDEEGRVIETPLQMFQRVARAIARAEEEFGASREERERWEERFLGMMLRLDFLPNSPTLMNADTPLGQLSACFVLPIEDSLVSIFDTLKHAALVHQSGGGTGFSFSRLRPRGDRVRSTGGMASGPVSFMRIYDTATEVIKQGGKRRGANMGILSVHHPDILEFIQAKAQEGVLANFNISVAITDAFMDALATGADYALVNPRTGKEVRRVPARVVFDLICTQAWRTGDPGIIFIDEINRHNPTPHVGTIEATNPCGEVPLLPYESCNLGSINLSHYVKNRQIDWERLRETVHWAIRFLDNVIQVNRYPIPQLEQAARANRKVGLGVMGWADTLIALGIPYDSSDGVGMAEQVMGFIAQEADRASRLLAQERGPFPNFRGSRWDTVGATPRRNATVTSIAPTGTLSLIAGCSSGIEPLFALVYVREAMEGMRLLEVNSAFRQAIEARGVASDALWEQVARKGSIRDMEHLPPDLRRLFVTDFDIAPQWHVRMQAAFQRHTENAVSKTINLPHDATVEDVKTAFLLAWELKCKGITVYRYGSKSQQVLYLGGDVKHGEVIPFVLVHPEYGGGCPAGTLCPI
ncbi:MAG: adenosylcobalamin-dependent ribonucleoside-diphosphate reductase [Dehalococcoidia bacterium]|nr:adenosylcobalamin-dependent ribonucleoside-diphosphate reductase [Dehalococcoidia bacterium]MDW8119320.1 adenosylcobalamin-dependent ribonucleoside-diphosphate reductase [Chloroflexota bacterium]